MTRDDIIRMMREACDADKVDAWHNDFWTITQEELERFAALVADAERLREDAERYRWLRAQHGIIRPQAACVFNIGHDWANVADGPSLDRDIDAARKEQP